MLSFASGSNMKVILSGGISVPARAVYRRGIMDAVTGATSRSREFTYSTGVSAVIFLHMVKDSSRHSVTVKELSL